MMTMMMMMTTPVVISHFHHKNCRTSRWLLTMEIFTGYLDVWLEYEAEDECWMNF